MESSLAWIFMFIAVVNITSRVTGSMYKARMAYLVQALGPAAGVVCHAGITAPSHKVCYAASSVPLGSFKLVLAGLSIGYLYW